jgi:hypothetical protein
MTKQHQLAMAATLAVVAVTIGCGKPEESQPPAAPRPAESAPAVSQPATSTPSQPAAPVATEQPKTQAQEITKVAADQFTALVNGFQSATPDTLKAVQDAVAAVRNKDYNAALPLLQKAMGDAKLTTGQQDLLKQAVETVKGYMAQQITSDPAKAASDLQKSLPFGK